MSPDFIRKRRRWLSESYCVYLRDTTKVGEQHIKALQKSAVQFMELIEPDISLQMSSLTLENSKEKEEYDGGE